MRTILIAAALSLTVSQAFAEGHEQNGDMIPDNPPKIEQPPPDVTNTNTNTNTNSANGGDSNAGSTSQLTGGDVNYIAIRLDALDSLPTADCQGASTSASAGGSDGLVGGVINIGRSGIDPQCTLRENISLVAKLSGDPRLIAMMMLQLDGLEHLWHIDQDEDCREWLIEGDDKAKKYDCRYPNVRVIDAPITKTLAAVRDQ